MTECMGFVGLGNIGRPMAANLVRGGYPLVVHDLDRARVAALTGIGAVAAPNAAAVARRAAIVLLSLPTSKEVEDVIFGPCGIAAGASAGLLVVDLTSGDPPLSRDIAARMAGKGLGYVDAGVSGGMRGAEAGTLGIMAGGSDADVARARPVLECIGASIQHMGPVGAGHLTKSLNNLLLAANMTVASEVLALAVKAGLDAEKVVAAINSGSGRSYVTEHRFPNFVLQGDFSHRGGMAMRLLLKDIAIACDMGRHEGVTMFVGNLVHQMVMRIADELGHDVPNQSVARAIEQWAGVEIRARGGE